MMATKMGSSATVAVAVLAAAAAAAAGVTEAFLLSVPSSGGVVRSFPAATTTRVPTASTLAPAVTLPSSCRRRSDDEGVGRLSMLTGAETQLGDSANDLLFAQMAGCTGLISAGYKITWDKGEEGEEGEKEDGEVDIFRDTALRYLGYANEVGEAFRPLVPELAVIASYGVAISYVTADAISKGVTCAKESDSTGCAFPASLDVLTFQMLASVVFPGFTINRWVAFVDYLITANDLEAQFPGVGSWLPTAAGLALIPFIVKPLDNLVELVLDKTIRPILVNTFPTCELEPIFGMEPLP